MAATEEDARVFIKTSEILNKWHTFDGIYNIGSEFRENIP